MSNSLVTFNLLLHNRKNNKIIYFFSFLFLVGVIIYCISLIFSNSHYLYYTLIAYIIDKQFIK